MAQTAVEGTKYYAAQNDRKPDLIMVVRDINGPVSLAAATSVDIYVDFPSGVKHYVATKDADQVANPGKLSYVYGVGDIPDAGEHRLQTVVSFGANIFETFPNNTYDLLVVMERIT